MAGLTSEFNLNGFTTKSPFVSYSRRAISLLMTLYSVVCFNLTRLPLFQSAIDKKLFDGRALLFATVRVGVSFNRLAPGALTFV